MAPPSDPSSAPPKNGAGPEAILKHVKDRKVVQWGFAYVAGAWLLLEILGHVTDTFGWSAVVDKVALSLAGLGLLLVLVLSWYHGEQGRQRVSGPELLIIALLLLLSGGALTILRGRGRTFQKRRRLLKTLWVMRQWARRRPEGILLRTGFSCPSSTTKPAIRGWIRLAEWLQSISFGT